MAMMEQARSRSADSDEAECRRQFEAAYAGAVADTARADRHPHHGERTSRFLSEYDRISALTGPDFCAAARSAIDVLTHGDEAQYERWAPIYAENYRDVFELSCKTAEGCLEALERIFSRELGKRGKPAEYSPKAKLFREEATPFLADAGRIRILEGKAFMDAATAAFNAFPSLDETEEVLAEALAQRAAAPMPRRIRIRVLGHFRRTPEKVLTNHEVAALEAKIESRYSHLPSNPSDPETSA
jgi:hypothetical protein